MPYKIVPAGNKCFVKHGRHAFSKQPIPCDIAKKQRTALILSELRKKHKIPPRQPTAL